MDTNLVAALIGFVGGLLGAVVGSRAAHHYARDQQRVQLTLDLYERYNSCEFLASRIAADRLLRDNMELEKPWTLGELYRNFQPSDWEHILRVRHFFAQLASLKRTRHIDENLAKELFGLHIAMWFGGYFTKLEA